MDVRVYAGGYYFARATSTRSRARGAGSRRGSTTSTSSGLQSRLTAQGIVQWDQPRGTQGFGGLELRIPLGGSTGSRRRS